MIHGQPKAKTFLSMFAKSATLFIRVSRKWSIPVGELIASTSASVAAQFPSKFLTKAALIAAFVYSGSERRGLLSSPSNALSAIETPTCYRW
jgi:hypothetical protein